MTDEQIIKALECCIAKERCEEFSCEICPFDRVYDCKEVMLPSAIAILNDQREEIKNLKQIIDKEGIEILKLQKRNTLLLEKKCKKTNAARKVIKSEAIKDFAKRLKSKLNDLEFRTKTHRKTVPTKLCDDNANWVMHECVPEEIDNLVKEMTEESE